MEYLINVDRLRIINASQNRISLDAHIGHSKSAIFENIAVSFLHSTGEPRLTCSPGAASICSLAEVLLVLRGLYTGDLNADYLAFHCTSLKPQVAAPLRV